MERSNELKCCISQIPLREPKRSAGQKAAEERDDPAPSACRGCGENSNMAIVRFEHGSGFIAWT
jgi:hypothetical protein